MDPRRRLPDLAVLIAVALIAAATLGVTSAPRTLPPWELCIACGTVGGANALLNILLFAPFGVAIRWRGLGLWPGVLTASILSLAIETAQMWIPGRHSTLGDVVCNALGATLGAWVYGKVRDWMWPTPAARRRLELATAVIGVSAIAATAFLFGPAPTHDRYYGQWTPELGHLPRYTGRVLAVILGDRPLPSGPLGGSVELAAMIRKGEAIRIRAIAGSPPERVSPLFSIHDAHRRQILLVGADHHDLVLRYRRRAADFRLAEPETRWRGALESVHPGDTLRIAIHRQGGRACLLLGRAMECVSESTVADGWNLLSGPPRMNGLSPVVAAAGWMWLLLVPMGMWSAPDRATLAVVLLITASVVIAQHALLHPLSAAGWVIAVAGYMSGVMLQRVLRSCWVLRGTSGPGRGPEFCEKRRVDRTTTVSV